MTMEFEGYPREDGGVGVRNYIAIIPTVGCANEVAEEIAERVPSCKPLLHHQGCSMTPSGLEVTERVLIGLGSNPNVAGCVLVSLGCESISVERVEEELSKTGKPVGSVVIQEVGGFRKAVEMGVRIAKKELEYARQLRRESFDLTHLTVGIKCGSSDATSGIASNPSVGLAVDKLIDEGGTAIFGEITEIIGAEHVLARRARNPEVAERIIKVVKELEEKIKLLGIDIRGSNPTPGNIRGGLSTIEEKSLGAIIKGGNRPIEGVLEYGERPKRSGLYVMISPGREMEFLTGPVAGGAQLILFTTGRGAPHGYPIAPVIKICGNPKTSRRLSEHIDVDVSGIISGNLTLERGGELVFEKMINVASGEATKAEIIGYDKTIEIYTGGMVL